MTLSDSLEDFSPGMINIGVDKELIKLQKQNIQLHKQKSLAVSQKAQREALKKEKDRLLTLNSKLSLKAKGYDDIPELLKSVKQAPIDKKKWLFVIAIEDYTYTDDIIYTANSAREFKRVAQKTLGIEDSHIFELSDNKATAGAIKGRLKSMLRRVNKDDQIYFYYSGHGIPVASQKNEPYMLPNDIIPEYIQDEEFFKLRNIYKLISDSKASKVIAIIDSCFSGATDNKNIIRGVAATRLKPKKVNFNQKKMVVLSAGKDKQYANKYDEKSHRLFTYFVMKSLLSGEKNVNKLYKDVYNNVSDESFKMGDLKLQEPTLMGKKDMSF